MTATPSLDVRCPQCGALVRAGADWCTLCYADLRPAPDPAPEPEPALPGPADLTVGVPEDEGVAGQPRRGRHARLDPAYDGSGAPTDADPETGLSVDAMLALLAAENDQPLQGLTSRLDTTGSRVVAMVGGFVVVMVVIFALMYLVGSLL